MKAYLIVCSTKDYSYFHNITGKNLLDAIKKALEENLEYFGNDPESSPVDFRFNKDNGIWEITNTKLEEYAKWHIKWMKDIEGGYYRFLVFDITKPEEAIQLHLESIISVI